MPLPQWDEITSAPQWQGLSVDQKHKVFRGYLTDLSDLPEWKALDKDQKFKVVDRMQRDGGMRPPDEAAPSVASDLWKTVKHAAGELGKSAVGAGEVVATLPGGMVAPVAGGLVGLAVAPFYGAEGAAKAIEGVRPYLTYKPMTESGRAATRELGKFFDFLIGKPTSAIGDAVKALSEPVVGEDASSWMGAGAKAVSELIGYVALFEAAQAPVKAKVRAGEPLTPAEKATFEEHLTRTGELTKAISEDLNLLAREKRDVKALPPGDAPPVDAITRIPGEGFEIIRGGQKKVIRRPPPETKYYKKTKEGKVYEYVPEELSRAPAPPESQKALPRGALEMPSFWRDLNAFLGEAGVVGEQPPRTKAQLEAAARLQERMSGLIEEAKRAGRTDPQDVAEWAVAQGLNPELKNALTMTLRRTQEAARPSLGGAKAVLKEAGIGEVVTRVAGGDKSVLPDVRALAEKLGPDAAHHEVMNGALVEAARNGTLNRMRKIEGEVRNAIESAAAPRSPARTVVQEVLDGGTVQDISGTSFIMQDGQRVGGAGGVHNHFGVMLRAKELKRMADETVSPHLIEKKFLKETGAVRTIADAPSSTLLYFTGKGTPTPKQLSSMLRGWGEFRKDAGGRVQVIVERINKKGGMTSMTTDRPTLEALERFFKVEKSAVRQILDDMNALFIKGEKGSIGGELSLEQLRARARLRTNVRGLAEEARRAGKESVDDVADWIVAQGIDPWHRPFILEALREGKYAKAVNLEKQNIPEELKEVERAAAEGQVKRTQTWDETGKLGEALRADYERMAKVVNRAKRGGALKAEEVDALRQLNVNAVHRLKEIVDMAPERFNEEFLRYREGVFKATSDAASTIGRALNVHKKEVSVNRLVDTFANLKRGLNERELKEFKELNFEDPNAVKAFMERLGDPTLRDYVLEFWYNSILSGPPTHLVNVASNTLWAAYQVPHRGLTGLMDAMGSTLTGRPREVFMSEVVPMLAGYKAGLGRGAAHAKEVVLTGHSTAFETKWNLDIGTRAMSSFERSPYTALRKASPVLTAPTRALRAMDVWANSMAFDAQLAALARREGLKRGLTGDALRKFEGEALRMPTSAMFDDAKSFARHSTFMDDPGKFTEWIIRGRSGVGEYASMGFRFIVPFVNTIANLMKRGMEFTPGVGAALMKHEGRIAPDILAKQVEGSILTLYVMYKLDEGRITGPAPESAPERDAFYREGKVPWAVKVGDTYYQYRRAEPFATPVAMAATAYEKIRHAKDDDAATDVFVKAAGGMVEYGMDSSYMQGLNNLFDKYGKQKGMLERLLASFVPFSSFWRSVGRAYEAATEGQAKVRDTSDLVGALSQTLPGGTALVKSKLNVWGEEISIPGGVFRQWLPFKWSEESTDPVEKELGRIGFYPALPDRHVRVREKEERMPDELYRDFALSYGHKAKADVAETIKQDWYKKRPDADKLKILDRRLTAIRERERERVKQKLRE